jgi:hypothetical protein
MSPPSSGWKNKPRKKPEWNSKISFLGYFSTLKMEATCSSVTSVDFQRTTRCHIPEDRNSSFGILNFEADVWTWDPPPIYEAEVVPPQRLSQISTRTPWVWGSVPDAKHSYLWTAQVTTYLPTYLPTAFLPACLPAYLLTIYQWLYSSFVGPWPFLSFLNLYTVGRTAWTGDQPVARPLPTHTEHKQNKRTQTSMPRVGFEPTIPGFELAKIFHASYRATPVHGMCSVYCVQNICQVASRVQ